MSISNSCQLITYPDSLGGTIPDVYSFLAELEGACRGVHLLPFFPSSGDRGFAPITYAEVAPQFGSWADIDELGRAFNLTIDFMINHISRRSEYFRDFLRHGDQSPFAHLFLRLRTITGGRKLSQSERSALLKRKAGEPVLEVSRDDGIREQLWCTFSEEQVDLDAFSNVGQRMIRRWLDELSAHPITMIRLDAFAYAAKRLGTSCFNVQPETDALLADIADYLHERDIEVLPEIHAHHEVQLKLADKGFTVYDFNLPLLVLHALYEGTNHRLRDWLRICPRKQITTLDTHDGIPVLDVEHLMSSTEIEFTKETLFRAGAQAERKYSVAAEFGNANLYQLNSTYYSALGNDDEAYLTARAIQFFAPGIPQVYYVGLLAGENDTALAEKTHNGRDLNRHNYTREEIRSQLRRPVVQCLLELMRFRNSYPAFNGDFSIEESPSSELRLVWRNGGSQARLVADLKRKSFNIDQ